MRNLKVLTMVVIGLMVMGSAAVYAAPGTEDSSGGVGDDRQTSTVTLTVDETCQLGIGGTVNPSEAISRDGNSETSYDAGYYTFSTKPILNVDANKNWRLTAKMSVWTLPAGYADGNKLDVSAASDLLLHVTGGNHITGFDASTLTVAPNTSATVDGELLTSTDQTIANHARGESNDTYTCTYSVFLDWANDIPGVYTTTVTYTLVTDAA